MGVKRSAMEMVAEFHKTFGLPLSAKPGHWRVDVPEEVRDLRVKLLREEFHEYLNAEVNNDVIEVADALADMLYVIYGTAISYGIDVDRLLEEVHRSNMTKLDENGNPIIREDGKILKSTLFEEPNIRRIFIEEFGCSKEDLL